MYLEKERLSKAGQLGMASQYAKDRGRRPIVEDPEGHRARTGKPLSANAAENLVLRVHIAITYDL